MSNENKKIKIKIHCNHQTKKKNRKISFKRKESKGFQSWDGPTAVESFIAKRLISTDRSFLMMKASTGWMGYKRRQEGQWCTVCNIYQWGIDNSIHHIADWFAGAPSFCLRQLYIGWLASQWNAQATKELHCYPDDHQPHTHTHAPQTNASRLSSVGTRWKVRWYKKKGKRRAE